MKANNFILVSIELIVFASGCTKKQMAQVVYNGVKSGECMKTHGTALYDSNQ